MSRIPDCIIIGGGLIGMLTARELLHAGLSVQLLERGETGRESSWAGGGILSPLYPWRYPEPVSALARVSQRVYPELIEAIKEEGGGDAQWTQSGLLMPDCEDIDAARVWAEQFEMNLQVLSPDEVADCAPELGNIESGGTVFLPDVAQVRNPRLAQALRASLLALGADIRQDCEVVSILHEADKVSAVLTKRGERLSAGHVVVAGGAWSAGLLAPLGLELPVSPVRGQMLLFRTEPGTVRRILLYKGRYVIPRRDGHVLVGSTHEHVGFDKGITAAARHDLVAAAMEIVPALADFPVEKQWAGLRPGSPDGTPFIGKHPEISNLYVNTGHYRNGVVLGPASAALLAASMLETPPELAPEAYLPAKCVNSG
jgi:glycine oxidase